MPTPSAIRRTGFFAGNSRLLALLAAAGWLAAACPLQASDDLNRGWHEIVLSVTDVAGWTDFWVATNGWEVVTTGELAPDTYRLPKGGGSATGNEALLRNPGTRAGYVRLIGFDQAAGQIRPNAQSWETGGWFDFNVRVTDLKRKSQELMAIGWNGYSDPVQFTFGPFVVREWLARGPDGIVIAMIERVSPALTGWPHLKDVSRVFNATQIVTSLDESLAFYRDTLGFDVYLEHEGPSRGEGPNVLGLPHNLADDIVRRVVIVHPDRLNLGSVELLEFVGATGRDFGERARAPRRGVLALRFPSSDLPALRAKLLDSTATHVGDIETISIAPYGDVERLIVRGPAGEQLEFVSSFEH